MTGLEMHGGPAWDDAVELADAEAEAEMCGSRVIITAEKSAIHVCTLPAGHAGPCSWALTAPSATGEGP